MPEGYLHLLHPALVHLTIAFLVVGSAVEAYGIVRRSLPAERFGGALVVIGTASLIPTVLFGFLAENSLTLSAAGASAVDDHERFGLIVLGVYGPLLVMKAWGRGRPPEGWRGLYAVGLIAGIAAVGVASYLGGLMVYRLGVGVGGP